MAAALDPILPAGDPFGQSTQVPTTAPSDVDNTLITPGVVPEAEIDPMLGYLDTLDPNGPRPPLPPLPGGDKEIGIQTNTD
ncbi:MAG: hypothetical protein KAS77_01175, partial [Thermoplasmata archaeon]|nr:hypothetical protein [Thermoplasmata archaeon]